MFISSFYCDIKRRNEPKKKNTLFVRESNDFAWNFLMLFLTKKLEKNSGAKSNSLYVKVKSGDATLPRTPSYSDRVARATA